MPSLSRHKLLAGCATGLTVGLAGCIESDAVISVSPVSSPAAIGRKATTSPDDRDAETTELIAATVAGGTNRTSPDGYREPPYQPTRPVRYNETVYTVDWTETGRQETRTEFILTITIHEAASGRDPELTFDELPAVDQERLRSLAQSISLMQRANRTDNLPKTHEEQVWYPPPDREPSMLVPTPEHTTIEVDGQPVTVGAEPTTVALAVYAYTATERAPSLATFGRKLRTAHRFSLTGLNDAERGFFEQVVDEGSFYKGSFDDVENDVFNGIVEQFVDQPALFASSPSKGEWLTRYDGTDYWVTIDFIRMPEYAARLQPATEP